MGLLRRPGVAVLPFSRSIFFRWAILSNRNMGSFKILVSC